MSGTDNLTAEIDDFLSDDTSNDSVNDTANEDGQAGGGEGEGIKEGDSDDSNDTDLEKGGNEESSEELSGEAGDGEGTSDETVIAKTDLKGDGETKQTVSDDGTVVTDQSVNTEPSLEEQNAALLKQIDDLAKKRTAPENLPTASDLKELYESADFDEIREDSEKFGEFILKVSQATEANAVQRVLQAIPEVVGKLIVRQSAMEEIKKSFYEEHEGLKPVQNYVAEVATQVAAEHADWTIPQVLTEAAERTYKNLNIKRVVSNNMKKQDKEDNADQKKKGPAFPSGKTSVRKGAAKITPLQKEINDILDD